MNTFELINAILSATARWAAAGGREAALVRRYEALTWADWQNTELVEQMAAEYAAAWYELKEAEELLTSLWEEYNRQLWGDDPEY